MATYKTIEARPVDRAAIVHHASKSPIDDLNEDEVENIHELVDLARFCGLAKRSYFNSLDSYCNSDCFNLYIQKFSRADFTALTTRRREGQTWSAWPIDNIAITIPVHCHPVREVTLDEDLLAALAAHRGQSKGDEWGKWQSAISCFNQANTDSDNIRHQVECVLLCGAFEHLLRARSEAKDVASKFTNVISPTVSLTATKASRRSDGWSENEQPLRYEWMREFYRIRGDFAHGKLTMQQPAIWNPLEHLVLATIAFPLVVKCLLNKADGYNLTDDDRAQIDTFEKFADTNDFLNPPTDQKNSLDSHWKRLTDSRKAKLVWQEAFERAWDECEGKGLIPPEWGESPLKSEE